MLDQTALGQSGKNIRMAEQKYARLVHHCEVGLSCSSEEECFNLTALSRLAHMQISPALYNYI